MVEIVDGDDTGDGCWTRLVDLDVLGPTVRVLDVVVPQILYEVDQASGVLEGRCDDRFSAASRVRPQIKLITLI